jgi:hypothetical protein
MMAIAAAHPEMGLAMTTSAEDSVIPASARRRPNTKPTSRTTPIASPQLLTEKWTSGMRPIAAWTGFQ